MSLRKIYSLKTRFEFVELCTWKLGPFTVQIIEGSYHLKLLRTNLNMMTVGEGEDPAAVAEKMLRDWLSSVLEEEGEIGTVYGDDHRNWYTLNNPDNDLDPVLVLSLDGVTATPIDNQLDFCPISDRVDSIREQALKKLTLAERKALGIK